MLGKYIQLLCKITTIFSYISCFFSLIVIPNNAWKKILLIIILIWAAVNYVLVFSRNKQKTRNRIHFVDLLSVGVFTYDLNQDLVIELVIKTQSSGKMAELIEQPIELDYIILFLSIVLLVLLFRMYLQTKGCNTRMQIKRLVTYLKYTVIYAFLLLINPLHQDTQDLLASTFLHITPNELTLMSAAAKYKLNNKRELHNKFPVILRKHASHSQSWRYWDFNISLVSANNIQVENNSASPTLLVNLADSNLSIINNAGKKFLREFSNKKTETIAEIKKNVISSGATTSQKVEIADDENFFLRWGSAGVIPVVEYKNELWIMFVFREIAPIGWNLALGGSKNEEEKKRPAITAIRELLEEVIIIKYGGKKGEELIKPGEGVDKHRRMVITHPFLKRIENDKSFREESEAFYRRQHDIMRDTYQIELVEDSVGSHVKCDDITTNMRVRVMDSIDSYPNNSVFTNNIIYIINPEEQGVECVKPIVMKIEGNCTLRMGEIDFSNDTWINNPMLLIKYSVVEEFMKAHPNIQELNARSCAGGVVISELFSDSQNYELFNVNISEREQRIQDLRKALKYEDLSDHEINKKANRRPLRIWRNKWKHYRMVNELRYQMNITKIIKECFSPDESGYAKVILQNPINIAFQFCPTTWKSMKKLVDIFDPGKIDEYCNYKIGD